MLLSLVRRSAAKGSDPGGFDNRSTKWGQETMENQFFEKSEMDKFPHLEVEYELLKRNVRFNFNVDRCRHAGKTFNAADYELIKLRRIFHYNRNTPDHVAFTVLKPVMLIVDKGTDLDCGSSFNNQCSKEENGDFEKSVCLNQKRTFEKHHGDRLKDEMINKSCVPEVGTIKFPCPERTLRDIRNISDALEFSSSEIRLNKSQPDSTPAVFNNEECVIRTFEPVDRARTSLCENSPPELFKISGTNINNSLGNEKDNLDEVIVSIERSTAADSQEKPSEEEAFNKFCSNVDVHETAHSTNSLAKHHCSTAGVEENSANETVLVTKIIDNLTCDVPERSNAGEALIDDCSTISIQGTFIKNTLPVKQSKSSPTFDAVDISMNKQALTIEEIGNTVDVQKESSEEISYTEKVKSAPNVDTQKRSVGKKVAKVTNLESGTNVYVQENEVEGKIKQCHSGSTVVLQGESNHTRTSQGEDFKKQPADGAQDNSNNNVALVHGSKGDATVDVRQKCNKQNSNRRELKNAATPNTNKKSKVILHAEGILRSPQQSQKSLFTVKLKHDTVINLYKKSTDRQVLQTDKPADDVNVEKQRTKALPIEGFANSSIKAQKEPNSTKVPSIKKLTSNSTIAVQEILNNEVLCVDHEDILTTNVQEKSNIDSSKHRLTITTQEICCEDNSNIENNSTVGEPVLDTRNDLVLDEWGVLNISNEVCINPESSNTETVEAQEITLGIPSSSLEPVLVPETSTTEDPALDKLPEYHPQNYRKLNPVEVEMLKICEEIIKQEHSYGRKIVYIDLDDYPDSGDSSAVEMFKVQKSEVCENNCAKSSTTEEAFLSLFEDSEDDETGSFRLCIDDTYSDVEDKTEESPELSESSKAAVLEEHSYGASGNLETVREPTPRNEPCGFCETANAEQDIAEVLKESNKKKDKISNAAKNLQKQEDSMKPKNKSKEFSGNAIKSAFENNLAVLKSSIKDSTEEQSKIQVPKMVQPKTLENSASGTLLQIPENSSQATREKKKETNILKKGFTNTLKKPVKINAILSLNTQKTFKDSTKVKSGKNPPLLAPTVKNISKPKMDNIFPLPPAKISTKQSSNIHKNPVKDFAESESWKNPIPVAHGMFEEKTDKLNSSVPQIPDAYEPLEKEMRRVHGVAKPVIKLLKRNQSVRGKKSIQERFSQDNLQKLLSGGTHEASKHSETVAEPSTPSTKNPITENVKPPSPFREEKKKRSDSISVVDKHHLKSINTTNEIHNQNLPIKTDNGEPLSKRPRVENTAEDDHCHDLSNYEDVNDDHVSREKIENFQEKKVVKGSVSNEEAIGERLHLNGRHKEQDKVLMEARVEDITMGVANVFNKEPDMEKPSTSEHPEQKKNEAKSTQEDEIQTEVSKDSSGNDLSLMNIVKEKSVSKAPFILDCPQVVVGAQKREIPEKKALADVVDKELIGRRAQTVHYPEEDIEMKENRILEDDSHLEDLYEESLVEKLQIANQPRKDEKGNVKNTQKNNDRNAKSHTEVFGMKSATCKKSKEKVKRAQQSKLEEKFLLEENQELIGEKPQNVDRPREREKEVINIPKKKESCMESHKEEPMSIKLQALKGWEEDGRRITRAQKKVKQLEMEATTRPAKEPIHKRRGRKKLIQKKSKPDANLLEKEALDVQNNQNQPEDSHTRRMLYAEEPPRLPREVPDKNCPINQQSRPRAEPPSLSREVPEKNSPINQQSRPSEFERVEKELLDLLNNPSPPKISQPDHEEPRSKRPRYSQKRELELNSDDSKSDGRATPSSMYATPASTRACSISIRATPTNTVMSVEMKSRCDTPLEDGPEGIGRDLRTRRRTPLKCNQCEFTTQKQSHLRMHMRSHIQPFWCNMCLETFSEIVNLHDHVLSKCGGGRLKAAAEEKCWHRGSKTDKNDPAYKCGFCDYSSSYVKRLDHHMKVHQRESLFTCSKCEFKTLSKWSLKRHSNRHVHVMPQHFECDECGFITVYETHFEQHMEIHRGKKVYTCDECSFNTSHVGYFNAHMGFHVPKEELKSDEDDGRGDDKVEVRVKMQTLYKCKTCGVSFKQQKKCRGKKIRCLGCQCWVDTSQKIEGVLPTNPSGERNECELCDFIGDTQKELSAHKRLHQVEDDRLVCKKCNQQLTSVAWLRQHTSNMHCKSKRTLV